MNFTLAPNIPSRRHNTETCTHTGLDRSVVQSTRRCREYFGDMVAYLARGRALRKVFRANSLVYALDWFFGQHCR